MASKKDVFTQQAYLSVTEDAAGTVKYAQLDTRFSLGTEVLWEINKIDYGPDGATLKELDAETDELIFGIAVSNQSDSPSLSDPAIVAYESLLPLVHGTPANLEIFRRPIVVKYDPPLAILPQRLYLFVQSVGFAVPAGISARVHYREVKITPQLYREILETYLMLGSS